MERITYEDLVARYGTVTAFDLLLKIEKLAAIDNHTIHFEEHERLQKALDALNTINFARNS